MVCIAYFFDQTPWLLFFSVLVFVQLLFKDGYCSRMATVQGWLLLKDGYCSRMATVQGWLLFEGGIYFFRQPADTNNSWIRYMQARVYWTVGCCQYSAPRWSGELLLVYAHREKKDPLCKIPRFATCATVSVPPPVSSPWCCSRVW